MAWQIKRVRALHERLVALTIITESIPWVHDGERLRCEEDVPGFWRATARFGFMEQPDVPRLLQQACDRHRAIDGSDLTWFVGHETVVPRPDASRVHRWAEAMYSFLQRN